MKILLVNTNQATQPYPVFPVGLCSIASLLKRRGYTVEFLDLCFVKDTKTEIEAKVKSFTPDLVGVGVRNLDNSDMVGFRWFLPEVREMVRKIRSCCSARLVFGGAAVSVMPREVLEYLEGDLAVVGDGEQPFLSAVKCLEEGGGMEELSRLGGLAGFHNGSYFQNAKVPVMDYEDFGTIDICAWTDAASYLKRGAIYPLQSNRGCAFHCIYCTYTQIEGKKYRLRPSSLVIEEIRQAVRRGVKYFEFVDSVFNVPESHAREICQSIIASGLKVKFGAAGLNPKWLTEALLQDMQKAGFESLDVTVESASGEMIKNLRKGFELRDVENAAERLRHYPMKVLWVFLLGGPGENERTLEESFDFIRSKVRPTDCVYITAGLRVYPDTPLAAKCLEEKAVQSPGDLVRPTFYLSEQLSYDRIREKVLQLAASHPNVIPSFDTDYSLMPFFYRVLHLIQAPQPYWRYSPFFSRVKSALSFLSRKQSRSKSQETPSGSGAYISMKEVLA